MLYRTLRPIVPASLLLFMALAAPAAAQTRDLLVTSRDTDEVLRYDGETGEFLGVFAAAGNGLRNPVGLTFGPDGHLYVTSADRDKVIRYDGETGVKIDDFATGVGDPRNLNFGPDGHLYVSSADTSEILRYDGATGELLGVFVDGGNGLFGPTSFTFGPDGDLYVGSVLTDEVKRYDGATGAFISNFATRKARAPHDVAFGPDGLMYVTIAFEGVVRRYDPVTGKLIDDFITDSRLSVPLGISWDGQGHLLVSNQGGNDVRRYDAATGDFVDRLVKKGSGGLSSPLFHAFFPARGGLKVRAPFPGTADVPNYVLVTGARPGARVDVLLGEERGYSGVAGCPHARMKLRAPLLLGTAMADEAGDVVLGGLAPVELAGEKLLLQALSPATCAASPVLTFRLVPRLRAAPAGY